MKCVRCTVYVMIEHLPILNSYEVLYDTPIFILAMMHDVKCSSQFFLVANESHNNKKFYLHESLKMSTYLGLLN